jgi:hypothetical protein
MREKFTVNVFWLQKAAICLAFFAFMTLKCEAQLGLPPTISVQPLDQTVTNMGTVTFSVTVDASLSLTTSYQWQLNGVDLKTPGASGTKLLTLLDPKISYTQPNNTSNKAGNYSVKLTAFLGGTRVSSNAVLKVVSTAVAITSAKMNDNGFQVHMAGITGAAYVLYASSNLATWVPVYTNSSLTGAADYTDSAAAQFSTRYYKVLLK